MKIIEIITKITQKLTFDEEVTIERCPDPEFSDLKCIKIGDSYFLPSIEWTKYVSAEDYSDDDAGGFEPVEGSDWEVLHHAITDEKTTVRNA